MEKTIAEYTEELCRMQIGDMICVMGIDVTCIYLNCKSYLFGTKFVGNLFAAREEVEMMMEVKNGR